MSTMDPLELKLFEAIWDGDAETVDDLLAQDVSVLCRDDKGFLPIHYVAMASNRLSVHLTLRMLKRLVAAGSAVDDPGADGRTALYFAAEFSPSLEPITFLLDAGAQADCYDGHGNHVVANAMSDEVQAYLSKVTGVPIPEPEEELAPVKMTAAMWRRAHTRIEGAFRLLETDGILALHDTGYTQEDGFSDATEQAAGFAGTLRGICFYTRQDQNRAKRTSDLSIAFWGAPDGSAPATQWVGQRIVEAFQSQGYSVVWDGSDHKRPTVNLRE